MSFDDLTPRTDDAAPTATTPGPVTSGPVTSEPVTSEPVGPTPATATSAHLRVGTVVWGLVLALLGVGVTAVGAGAALDLQAALIVLLVAAGTALLVGAFVTAKRARARG